jgi:hypothetical protein
MMYGHEKSRSAIVAVKPTNKAERSVAERTDYGSWMLGACATQDVRACRYRLEGARSEEAGPSRKSGRRPLQNAGLRRRGLLIGHFGSAAVRDPDGQNELESRPILAVRQRRKFAAVTLDYHAANCQSQSHSIWLCRDEWIKYAVQSS